MLASRSVKRALLCACVVLLPAVASAAEESAATLQAPHERRAGVVVGMSFGAGLGGASGYPNSATKIGDSAFYSASDLMTGLGNSIFVMGALSDYVSFGMWFGSASFDSAHWHSSGVGGGFRVEAFPLYQLVPKLADLGVFSQLGIGSTTLRTKLPGNYPTADGAQSYLGAGAFFEAWNPKVFGGHFALGPTIEYDVITARAIERHGALAGLRVVFYGGK